jgi:hypothetical protein
MDQLIVADSPPLLGYFAWALESLVELEDVRLGLRSRSLADAEADRQLPYFVGSKFQSQRIVIRVVPANEPPPDPTEQELADFGAMLGAFLGGAYVDEPSLSWLGRFLRRSTPNQTLTIVRYLEELFGRPPSPRPLSERTYWRQVLTSAEQLPFAFDRGASLVAAYKALPARHD